jgi:hypothetical protein
MLEAVNPRAIVRLEGLGKSINSNIVTSKVSDKNIESNRLQNN